MVPGVSPAAPYRHFPDRDSLLAALAAEGFAILGEAQREAVSLAEKIGAVIDSHTSL